MRRPSTILSYERLLKSAQQTIDEYDKQVKRLINKRNYWRARARRSESKKSR